MFITSRESHAREITVSEVNRGQDDKVRDSNSSNFLPMHTWLLTARLIHYRILDYRSRTIGSRLTDGITRERTRNREKAGFQFARVDYASISDLRARELVPPAFIYSYGRGESLVEFTEFGHLFSSS